MVLRNDELETVIEKIKELRKHIPLWQLARDIGVSQSWLSQILNGRIVVPEPGFAAAKLRDFIRTLNQKHEVKSTDS